MGNQLGKDSQPLYELQKSCRFKRECGTSALAINKNGSLILTDMFCIIHLIGFNGKTCKQISEVQKHKSSISVLKFFNLRQQFISGSCDSSIIIWALNHNYGTRNKYIQKLQGHTSEITCLEIHHLSEDLMVSGDYKGSIYIWSIEKNFDKQNSTLQWKQIQIIRELKSEVFSLSINETGNQIISCDRCSFIIVIEKDKYQNQWFLKKKIEVSQLEGSGVNFIDEDRFIFQSNSKSTLDLYQSKQEGPYFKVKELQLQNYQNNGLRRTSIFNKKQNILTIKKGTRLLLIKFKEHKEDKNRIENNQDLQIEEIQTIVFKSLLFPNAMSDDGQYFIIKDQVSRSIEIWQLRKPMEK